MLHRLAHGPSHDHHELLVRRKSVMGDLVVKGACLLAGMDVYSGDGPAHRRHGGVDERLKWEPGAQARRSQSLERPNDQQFLMDGY